MTRRFALSVSNATHVHHAMAALEALADFVFRQVTADEHQPAGALLAVLPGPLMVAVRIMCTP
jgi:hypothetical protein